MIKPSKGPWLPLRSFEYFDETGKGSYFEPEPEDLTRPYVGIGSSDGKIITAHDLFSFKNEDDATLIAHAPDLLETVQSALYNLEKCQDQSLAEYQLRSILQKINDFKKNRG